MSFSYLKMMFYNILILSIILGLSSNNIFMFWVSLELNMLSFVCLLILEKSKFSKMNFLLYFLPQAISSSMILLSMMFFMKGLSSFIFSLIVLGLILKTGMFPFHMWFIRISMKLSLKMFFFILYSKSLSNMFISIVKKGHYSFCTN